MKRRTDTRRLMAGIAAGTLLAATGLAANAAAPATSASTEAVDEIVVTAQRRAETIQTVPMAITALTSKALVAAGIANFQDYAVRIPNLAFAYSGDSMASSQTIAIRGVYGVGTTGMYLDDTPLPESVDPRVLDLDRIEVLKGPQGTLYGARSMGGTVRLISALPDASAGQGFVHMVGSATRGGGVNGTIDGAINHPLVQDRLALRVSAFADYESGVFERAPSSDAPARFDTIKNVAAARRQGGSITFGANLLDDKLTIVPRLLFQDMDENGHPYADVSPGNFVQKRWFALAEPGSDSWRLYSLTAKYKTPFGDITSDTSRFVRDAADSEDSSEVISLLLGTPPVPVLFHHDERYRAFTQEVRFTSRFDGPLQINAGVFYQDSKDTRTNPPVAAGPYVDNIFSAELNTEVEETAVFGEATYDLTSKLRLIAGARWFDNQVLFRAVEDGVAGTPGGFSGKQHERGVNPKFSLQYRLADDRMVYATAAKGFRIGGVNAFPAALCAGGLAAIGLTPAQAESYNSDSVWSYEVGAKTSWLERRLTVNGSLFDIEWSDVQQVAALPSCGFQVHVNGGAARSRGGEFEAQIAVSPALKLSLGAGDADAQIVDPGPYRILPAGSPIPQIPKWTLNVALDYRFELPHALPAFIHADYAYVGSSLSQNNSVADPISRPAYALANLRTGIDFDHVTLSLFANNIFDEHANLADVQPESVSLPGRPRIATNRPLTIGLDARARF